MLSIIVPECFGLPHMQPLCDQSLSSIRQELPLGLVSGINANEAQHGGSREDGCIFDMGPHCQRTKR